MSSIYHLLFSYQNHNYYHIYYKIIILPYYFFSPYSNLRFTILYHTVRFSPRMKMEEFYHRPGVLKEIV
nr:MAG TPA: hypothetical protein [Caudoviricetes sp.]